MKTAKAKRVAVPALLALLALAPAPTAAALCGNNCLLVNDASDATHASCDFSGIGTCSLRDAITKSNSLQGWSMQFAIGTGHQVIAIATNLPDIITRGTIDGTTQPGYAGAPLIELRRTDAGTANHGLHFTTDGLFTVRALVINHFPGAGCLDCYAIAFDSPGSNFVEGCYIGTDAAGMAADGNETGIRISTGVGGNTIGGTTAAKRNVISGNSIAIRVTSTNDNLIQGNYIGTNAAGSAAIPNLNGIAIQGTGSTGNLIGGDTPSQRNVIAGLSGQTNTAILLSNGASNVVKGNYIGTDVTGLVSLPYTTGVELFPESNDTVAGNVISVVQDGIRLLSATGTTIRGNFIGTDATGNRVLAGGSNGILLGGAQNNFIGGSGAGEGNVIGGFQYGVYLNLALSTGNSVLGNLIGLGADLASPVPNVQAGVVINSNGNNFIGGIADGDRNVVAYSGRGTLPRVISPGVWIQNGTADAIRANSIFGNTGKGIELYPAPATLPYPNDAGDADVGSNALQNFPLITGVTITPDSIRIQGTLESKPATSYAIDFYATFSPIHPGDLLQGKAWVGDDSQLITDAQGKASFDHTFAIPTVPNLWITATATDPGGSTSEFSQRSLFSVTPNHGPAAGGTATTFLGQLFQSGAVIRFGPIAAVNPIFVSATKMIASSPALAAGQLLDVTVTNPDGSLATMQKAWVSDFLDVPAASPLYSYVISLVSDGVSAGCGGGNFCPNANVTRAQMAVFLLKAKYGPWWSPPPATGTVFADVPLTGFAAAWIEELFHEGITGGCGGNNYCPGNSVTRQQMAVFLLKTEHGPTYAPVPCAGLFGDVACPGAFTNWIERLYAEGITGGCSASPLLYCPGSNVTRGQMAVFVVRTFVLP